jgi:GH35 family endo-1,4-beta-xylanase
MAVIGHNLVWHSQTPRWVWDGPDGALADRATMLARMRTHIMTVVGRYAGSIRGWDVVNEALNEDGTLRDSPWRRGIGDDYIARAFEFAHDADPKAELYYNDYNLATKPEKRAGAIRVIKDLQQHGIRIDAVGEQGPLAARHADARRTRSDDSRPARNRCQGDDHGAGRQPAAAGTTGGARPASLARIETPTRTACPTTCSRRSRAITRTCSACC